MFDWILKSDKCRVKRTTWAIVHLFISLHGILLPYSGLVHAFDERIAGSTLILMPFNLINNGEIFIVQTLMRSFWKWSINRCPKLLIRPNQCFEWTLLKKFHFPNWGIVLRFGAAFVEGKFWLSNSTIIWSDL